MTVVEATEAKLQELEAKVAGISEHPFAATALVLAAALDSKNSLTSKQMAAARLVEIIEKLEARVPAAEDDDEVGDLAD